MLRELPLVRHTSTIFYLLSAMVAAAVAVRGLGSVFVIGHQSRWVVASLLLIFGLLLATERLLSQRWAWYPHGYLAFQTGLILALLLLPPYFDFFAALGLPLSAQALGEMRALLFELRPPDLEEEGLAGALQARLDAVEARAGLETELIMEADESILGAVEDGLYRIAQEALSNVLKHAQARHVTVSLRNANDAIVLEVADDGCGLDLTASRTRGGIGLRSMEERATQLGGTSTVRSAPCAGTHILVEVPR